MADFHVGDNVRVTRRGMNVTFTITEIERYELKDFATGDGRAWWGFDELDYDLSLEQKIVQGELERAHHSLSEAKKHQDEVLAKALKALPRDVVARIIGT